MLNELILNNFKLFKERTKVPLSRINLFTGVNGRGKSTVLQSFLLLMQSSEHDRTTDNIHFNGSCVNLGFFEDVKNVQNGPSTPINFAFSFSSDVIQYYIDYTINFEPEDELIGKIVTIKIHGAFEGNPFQYSIDNENGVMSLTNPQKKETVVFPSLYDLFVPSQFQDEILFQIYNSLSFLKVHYISADRIGPKLYYTSITQRKFNSTGATGEHTVSTLFHSKDLIVDPKFIEHIGTFYNVIIDEIDRTVAGQTNFWLDKIFYGAKYQIKPVVDTNLLKFEISPDGNFDFHKPTNVGYGFSYVLPIIVSGLIAKPGEMMIIENPEAHLHPYAQSIIAKFLTLVSIKDVQVIIESHSEHILNGLRIPVFEGITKKEDLNVLYFDRNPDKQYSVIELDDDGGIRNWPKDFFDQSTKDFNHLLGL